MFEIIQLGGFLVTLLGKFVDPLMEIAVPLAKNVLAPLATMASASAIGSVTQKKIRGGGVVRARKGITLVISNEDINDIVIIIKSLQN